MKVSKKYHVRKKGAGKKKLRRNPRKLSYASPKLTMAKLKSELAGFTGTENYYKHWMGFHYTDGVKYMAENTQAYWLLDIVGSYQHKFRHLEFQIWNLEVNKDKTAVVTMQEDSSGERSWNKVRQCLEYTDFPVGKFKMYFQNNVLLLPSED